MRSLIGLALVGFGAYIAIRRDHVANDWRKISTGEAFNWIYEKGSTAIAAPPGSTNAPGAEYVTNTPRGIRNNNPGNLRDSGDMWLGLASPRSDGGYLVFSSAYYGLRALAINLRNQQSRHGLRSVRAIITKYAPPFENATGAYVNAVASTLGVGPDTPISLADRAMLAAFMKAVVRHENGQQPYSDAEINNATAAFSFV